MSLSFSLELEASRLIDHWVVSVKNLFVYVDAWNFVILYTLDLHTHENFHILQGLYTHAIFMLYRQKSVKGSLLKRSFLIKCVKLRFTTWAWTSTWGMPCKEGCRRRDTLVCRSVIPSGSKYSYQVCLVKQMWSALDSYLTTGSKTLRDLANTRG